MQFARITPDYAVAPQIQPEDAADVSAAGFTDVICNRPDDEVEGELSSASLRAALEAEGLRFHFNPVWNGALTEVEVARQAEAMRAATGPVLAYCRSGTRSSLVWALGQREMAVDDVLEAAARAGYDLSGLRSALEAQRR